MILEYRSIEDMNYAILRNLYKIPKEIDLVVGIPRSGMLPANLIALYLNKPYTDIDSYISGRIYATGVRGLNKETRTRKVLIMDDSISSGNAMNKVKRKIANPISDFLKESSGIEYIYGVVYTTSWSKHMVDFYCEEIDDKRIFQWNLFHHPWITSQAFFDIDGVLCPNPPIDDDGKEYMSYISNAPLLYKPTVEINTLVSCRLEKYRNITEEWLRKNNIKYKHLIMLDMPTRQDRLKWGKHGLWKGTFYKRADSFLFVESSLHEARQILNVSHKPVFCIETFELLNEESVFMKRDIRKKWHKYKILLKTIINWKSIQL